MYELEQLLQPNYNYSYSNKSKNITINEIFNIRVLSNIIYHTQSKRFFQKLVLVLVLQG